jgi:ferritin
MLQKNTEERNDAEALVKFIKSKNIDIRFKMIPDRVKNVTK